MMKRLRRSMMLVCAFSLFTIGSIYAAEPTEVPSGAQTGDEVMAAKAAETVRGKLLRVQDAMYTVETAPGTQASIRAENNTKFEGGYKGSEGDWIEALVTPDMQIKSLKRSPSTPSLRQIRQLDRRSGAGMLSNPQASSHPSSP